MQEKNSVKSKKEINTSGCLSPMRFSYSSNASFKLIGYKVIGRFALRFYGYLLR